MEKVERSSLWELRRDSKTWVSSPIPNCGYDREALLSLKEAGYKLYRDGKAVKI